MKIEIKLILPLIVWKFQPMAFGQPIGWKNLIYLFFMDSAEINGNDQIHEMKNYAIQERTYA